MKGERFYLSVPAETEILPAGSAIGYEDIEDVDVLNRMATKEIVGLYWGRIFDFVSIQDPISGDSRRAVVEPTAVFGYFAEDDVQRIYAFNPLALRKKP